MKDDVRTYIYGTLVVFVVGVLVWVGFIYVNACSFTLTCSRGALSVERTPIPTLYPATLPGIQAGGFEGVTAGRCHVHAVDLIGAWVEAGSPETASFQFKDVTGRICESSFEEEKPLFLEANIWYPGSISCVSCHSVDLTISPAQLDLSSYTGILAGSRRTGADSKGTDILGGGNWKGSILHDFLSTSKAEVPGHTVAVSDFGFLAGRPLTGKDLTETPVPLGVPADTPAP